MSNSRKYLTLLALSLSGGSIYFLPYLKYVFYDPVLQVMNINNEQMGFLLTLYAIGCMTLYIPGGLLADRVSAKKALIWSLLGTSALSVLFAFTFNYRLAEVIWFLLAVTSGFVFWSALIKAIRLTGEPNEQARLYGLYYAGNGGTAAIVSALALWAFARFDDPATGLRMAILVGAAATTLAALLVALFLREEKEPAAALDEEDRFRLQDVRTLLKNPLLWAISIAIFCTYGLYTSGSYFIPYLTNVTGVAVEDSSALGIIRTYVFMLICAPIGGYFADKLRSTSRWFVLCFSLMIALYLGVLLLPRGTHQALVIFLSLLPGAVSLMMYGIMYSTITECRIPVAMTGTAVGIASIIGYLPDFMFNTMFGRWLDQYGNQGYNYIFLFLTLLAVLGLGVSLFIRLRTRKMPSPVEEKSGQTAI
ncbi:MAG: MFS transporter [Desulfurispora sp.]|uniref:MFS transporter n=1 Tax=Desulfurispora sp. TaxID=3014275 RepID=UPI00404B1085